MKIAIQHNPHSFSEQWIKYCEKEKIEYKLVDAFDSNIINQLKGYDIFMWHHHHAQYKDVLTAKRILFALEHSGIKVFPDFKTGWHFDDKVAQKYLLEAIDAPLVPSYVFYDKKRALEWAKKTSYPKVFKLKGGASANNVKLVKNYSEAVGLINKAFGKGFAQFDRIGYFKEKFNKFRNRKGTFIELLKGFVRIFIVPDFSKQQPVERGYVYFQDFIPNNNFDTRIVVINGEVAVAERRFVRKGDFRASGSGDFTYDNIDIKSLEIAFNIANKLGLNSVAYDFILDEVGNPLIVEISYGFGTSGISKVPGYWDKHLMWHEKKFRSEDWIIKSIINK